MTLPDVSDAFRWTQEVWGPALRCRPLESLAPHLFSTRQLTLTSEDDERWLREAIGGRTLSMLAQVHGTEVVVVRESNMPVRDTPGDVLVSIQPGAAIGVRAADCVPVLIADRATGAVAAVHAGWRGTAASACVVAVRALGREFGSRPADLVVAIGPSIGTCCYEVGSEVFDAFAAAGHARYLIDRWFAAPATRGSHERPALRLDVAGANRDQLILTGVPADQIHVSGLCTAMHLDLLTSYRVEKSLAGRLVGVICAQQDR
jgi:polyphenol oxidase